MINMKSVCCCLFGLVLGAVILFLLFKFKFMPELESSYTMSNKTCVDEKTAIIAARDTATGCDAEKNTLTAQLNASTTSLSTCRNETNKLVADLNTATTDLSKLIPDPSKVDRYWGCISPTDTPAGYIWATTDTVVQPKLTQASKIGLQAQLDVVRDSYPTAKYVAVTQSWLHSDDSLYILWSTDPPSEKKIDSRNRRCLLPSKDGYVGCKIDTPVIGCLGDPAGGVTWTVYKIR